MTSEPSVNDVMIPTVMPTPKQQSWGAVISIVIIVLMIIVGAFYAWGKRVAQGPIDTATTTEQETL
ncbi:hypothetical protein A3G63_00150 [Candidatus Kaiserbacteria bacterium RIFCSPLOWO2_12_FULL_52_8]|uniref:Uncharacterized protein n=1 Tax=Candidatus Kaiserbacteria bacterium RIFCSPHIGHO2_01_FULL_53_31 TaxID=1798481 RepID=A0A1F6CHA7_9BACT|nr:MAG: hypothetical protein A2678_03150 [Candidatus Kaiserbacteria bacterium RIFCSPHIGHO2_01_FULL_53_31]OGG94434.1 MAG: hypothetical protein A3G63_00150 [Candidatus Kaiserbacteria bacterium RIFCSPLOWO2_12_FULL_52_8]